jgi:hypothetical protein
MRLLFRVAIVLTMCLITIALPAAPVRAAGGQITVSPNHGVPGEEVTIYGSNFTAETRVSIYYYPDGGRIQLARVDTDEDGAFEEDITIPESYTGTHEVSAYIGSSLEATDIYRVEPGVTVDPEEGPVGTNVTVTGHGFFENEQEVEVRYYLDSSYATIAGNVTADGDGWWEKVFQIPPSSQGGHKIDAEGPDSTFAEVQDATLDVMPSISVIDEFGNPIENPSGSPGENITMMGNGFHADDSYIKILFDGEEMQTGIIRADDNGHWQGNFEVPPLAGGTYDVTAEGQYTGKKDVDELSFEIGPGLVLSPGAGHIGTDLTVRGGGFNTGKNVVIKYDGTQEATATTNSSGSFTTTFLVPESQHGARQVSAEVNGIVEATTTFTMESVPPPIPELVSPLDESRVGIIGRVVRPTFEWSEVFDVSGVHYSLQIARTADLTATGLVDPIVSVQNIVGTNYTLGATEALPYGTYYWIVQAVDGAQNAGNWTAPGSFRAGVLPLWAFILAIVVVAAGIGTAVYLLVVRHRIRYL